MRSSLLVVPVSPRLVGRANLVGLWSQRHPETEMRIPIWTAGTQIRGGAVQITTRHGDKPLGREFPLPPVQAHLVTLARLEDPGHTTEAFSKSSVCRHCTVLCFGKWQYHRAWDAFTLWPNWTHYTCKTLITLITEKNHWWKLTSFCRQLCEKTRHILSDGIYLGTR